MQSKYHHLIPKTYLSAWANNSGTLQIKWLNNGKTEPRNVNNVAGVNHFYSIIAGMPFCKKKDTDYFFDCLNKYTVIYNNLELKDSLEMNKYYGDFNNWSIIRSDGSPVSKKTLKAYIDSKKIQYIEELWSKKYENNWGKTRDKIKKIAFSGKSYVRRFDFYYLMNFFTALDWRSLKSNATFNEQANNLIKNLAGLDKIEIPNNELGLPIFKTAADYIEHCILLKYYKEFLLCGTGPIYTCAQLNMKHTSFHFLVASGEKTFITSDNPAFICDRGDGSKIGIMPISPKILLVQGKNSSNDKNYYISQIDDSEVLSYNKRIENNAEEFIILDQVLI